MNKVSRQHESVVCKANGTGARRSIGGWGAGALTGLAFILLSIGTALGQNGVGLQSMSFSTLPGDQVQVSLKFSRTPPEPLTFTIDNPARVALDFPNTSNLLEKRSQTIGIGIARSVNTAEAKGRTRVVLNLDRLVGYQTEIIGNELLLTLGSGDARPVLSTPMPTTAPVQAITAAPAGANAIESIDFRRGPAGQGRVLVRLSNPGVPIDLREQGGNIVVDFANTNVPADLAQRLDVTDFATSVETIETFVRGNNTKMTISAKGRFEHLAYQSDDLYTVEIRERQRQPAQAAAQPRQKTFTGERLSLNFQDIEVRSVLQLIADFTGLNVVVSDTVGGSLTLRLKNVPWDQALDIILKTKGLAMRQVGNVILVAPSEEIAAREKLELEAQQQVEELAPLRSEFVQINYAKAADIASLLKAPENSLLSERGNVSIDTRTNTLLVQDTVNKLNEVRDLVGRLDVPVRQVLIESRIVIANDDFQKELGARFGLASIDNDALAGLGGADDFHQLNGSLEDNVRLREDGETELTERLNVNLPIAGAAGSIGLSLAKLPFGTLIELELSAAQAENRAQTISSPRVITSNQTTARIEQGTEIPFQEASSSGATSVSFKKAVLSLEVTPQITPDDRVFLDINVSNDTVGENVQQTGGGVAPSIDTREVETRVLVDNGQTVVLGGIHEQRSSEDETKVPFFGDIPLIGRLFKTTRSEDDKSELLIFITPKIINEDLTLAR
ncbi:MAG: type IV pilus secretin PilQ [Gammaproteobacteria bacterium]